MRLAYLISALVLVPTSIAFPAPDAPMVDSVSFASDGVSTAWRVFLPQDSFFSVWMLADHEDLTFGSFALWFVDPETFEFSMLINPTWFPEGGHELHVAGEAAGALASEVTGEYPWPVEMRVDYQPFFDQEWLVVVMGAFEGDVAGEFRAYADGGAQILATTRGDAFLHTERDFEGAANVIAREELPVREAVVEAKVQRDLSITERSEGRMFASFWGGDHLDMQQLSVTPAPAIGMSDAFLIPGGAPGDHTFSIDQNVDWYDNQPTCRALYGERCWRTPTFVLGADITIP